MNLDDISKEPTPQVPEVNNTTEPKTIPETTTTQSTSPPVPTQSISAQVGQPTSVPPQQAQSQINVNVAGAKENILIEGLNTEKKKNTNGFFRILTLLSLTAVGFLMLGESTGIIKLNIQLFNLDMIYPVVVLLSVVILFIYKNFIGKLLGFIMFIIVVGGLSTITIYHSLVPGGPSKFDDGLVFDLNNNKKSIVHFNTYVGDYIFSSKNFSGSTTMMAGTYQSDRALLVTTGFNNENTPYLYLNEDNNRNITQDIYSNLNLYLSESAIFDLYLKNFFGNYNINLSDVIWEALVIHGGIGSLNLNIGNDFKDGAKLEIKSARSKINIKIPKNVGVKLYYKQIAGSIELQNFKKIEGKKNYYESLNIDNASKVVEIETSVGIGKFKAVWLD